MPVVKTEQEIKEKYEKFHETLTSCFYQPKGKRNGYPIPTWEEVEELEAWAGQEIAEVTSPVETSIGLVQFNEIHGNIHSEMEGLLIAGGFLEPPPTPGPYIGTREIKDEAVTEGKIPPDALTHLAIGPGGVRESELATGAVTGAKVAPGAITVTKIADDAVTKGKIKDGEVSRGKLEDNAVNTGKLEDDAVTTEKLSKNAVKKIKIMKGAVDKEKLDKEVKFWQLQYGQFRILRLNDSNDVPFTDMDMDTAMAGVGLTVPIDAVGVIVRAQIRDWVGNRARCQVQRNGGGWEVWTLHAQAPMRYLETTFIIPLDKGNIFEYNLLNTGNINDVNLSMWVEGWVIEGG